MKDRRKGEERRRGEKENAVRECVQRAERRRCDEQ